MRIYARDAKEENQTVERTPELEEEQSIHKTFAGEKKKLSQMTRKEKFDYIISYYKYHIIIVAFVIIFAGSMIHQRLTYQEPVLCAAIVNDHGLNVETMQSDFAELADLTEHEKLDVFEDLTLDDASLNGSTTATMGENAYYVHLAAQEIDFAICDSKGLACTKSLDGCQDPKDFLSEETYEKYRDRITEDAIDITGTAAAEYLGTNNDPVYIVITNLSGHDDTLMMYLEYLLNL